MQKDENEKLTNRSGSYASLLTTLLQPNGRNSRLPHARPNSWSPQGSGLARGWQPTTHCRKALLRASYFLYSVKIATRGEDIRMECGPEPDGEGWGRQDSQLPGLKLNGLWTAWSANTGSRLCQPSFALPHQVVEDGCSDLYNTQNEHF